jgi:hypothetical protein
LGNFRFKLSPFERAQKSPFEVPPTSENFTVVILDIFENNWENAEPNSSSK